MAQSRFYTDEYSGTTYVYGYIEGYTSNKFIFRVLDEEAKEVCLENCDFPSSITGNLIIPETVTTTITWDDQVVPEANQATYKIVAIGNKDANSSTGAVFRRITGVTFPEGLKIIYPRAFFQIQSTVETPTALVLPASLETIGEDAFNTCMLFSSVDFSRTKVTSIPNNCFVNSSVLTSINLNNGLIEEIGESAFSGCLLSEVTIPASVKLIKQQAFSDNATVSKPYTTTLTNVTFEGDQTWLDGESIFLSYRSPYMPTLNNVPYYMNYHFTANSSINGGGRYGNRLQVATIDFVYKPTKAWQTFSTLTNMLFDSDAYSDGLRVYTITNIDAENARVVLQENEPTDAGKLLLYGSQCYVLYGTPGTTYHMEEESTAVQTKSSTYLVGDGRVNVSTGMSTTTVPPTSGENTNMILKDGKFVKVSEEAALPAGKAYLTVPTATLNTIVSSAPQLSLGFGGEEGTTVIETIETINLDGSHSYYDLNGRRLDGPKRGLNIMNGKKVIIK